jgi:preprotein translocase subunit YajC
MLGLIATIPFLFALAQAPGTGGAAAPAVSAPVAPAPGGAPATALAPGGAAPAAAPPAGAAATPPAGAAAQKEPSPLVQFLPLVAIIGLFYFMMIRPQQQEEKKRKERLSRLERNDRVITAGGIYGTVVSVDKDAILLRLGSDPGVKVEFTKASVVRILEDPKEKAKEV